VNVISRAKKVGRLKDKGYRDAYVAEHVRTGTPHQIRILREQREWTQGELGRRSGKPQNVISRLEDPNYGKLTIQSLLDLASAFDVALIIKFVPFSRLMGELEKLSPESLEVPSFSQDAGLLKGAKNGHLRSKKDPRGASSSGSDLLNRRVSSQSMQTLRSQVERYGT